MKCWIVSLMMVLGSLQAFSQQEYFIYVQANNNQPFYVRINGTTYGSAASGYIIISKLPDSVCNMIIGFPENILPEQEFSIPVNRKDGGYTLTNYGDKGWAMLNLQTQAVIMASNTDQQKKKPEIAGTKRTDAFSVLLSNAVNDSSVLYTVTRPPKTVATIPAVATKEENKSDSGTIAAKTNTKKDTLTIVKRNVPQKTNTAVVKLRPGKNAPLATAKKNGVNADSAAIVKTNILKKDSLVIAQKKMLLKTDTTGIAKNNAQKNKHGIAQPKKGNLSNDSTIAIKNSLARQDSMLAKRKTPVKKDTSAIVKASPLKNRVLTATPKKKYSSSELDAIIKRNIVTADSIMNARKKSTTAQDSSITVKNNPEKIIDSTGIAKITAQKKDTIGLHNIPEKADSSSFFNTGADNRKNNKLSITKAAELLTDTSYIAVFIDQSKEKYDTIRISIPFTEVAAIKKELREPEREIKTIDSAVVKTAADTTHIVETIHKEPVIKTDSSLATVKDTVTEIPRPKPVMENSDCKNTAWDSDIDKLRIRMLLVKSTEEKIILAKKIYTQKCFTVKQVRALSELFTTDEGKYKWCDAVYSYVADSANFSALADLFKEEYYLNRFKAMLRN